MRYKHFNYLAVALAGGSCFSAMAQNLLSNPGFEDSPTSITPWVTWNFAGAVTNSIDTLSPYAGLQDDMLAITGAGGINQVVASGWSLTDPGYVLSIHAKDASTGTNGLNMGIRLQFLNSSNTQIANWQLLNINVPADGQYHLVTATLTGTVPAATASIRPDFLINTVNNGDKVVQFDNASVTVVPEPSMMALAGLGGLSLLLFSRKQV